MTLTHFIELLGIFSFAASGAFAAMEKKLDFLGVLIIAFATAIGGGTIRDVLIGSFPVAWLSDMQIIITILMATGLSLFFSKILRRFNKLLFIFDAIGLGLFALAGLQKAAALGFSPGICIALGTITACFGGVLRDVLLNNVPLIFHREIYASACIAGGILYFLLLNMQLSTSIAEIISILVIVLIRLLAVRFNWSLPKMQS